MMPFVPRFKCSASNVLLSEFLPPENSLRSCGI
jgi:hypothetical protein